jgi:hypothetical protein
MDANASPQTNGDQTAADATQRQATPGPHPLDPLIASLKALQAYVSYYLAIRTESLKVKIRQAALMAAMGLLGLLAGAGLVIYAVVLLLSGIAEGLTVLFGNRAWAGDLLTGGLFLAIVFGGMYAGMRIWTKISWRKTEEKYERRRNQQRADLGRDVHETAEARDTPF